MSDDHAAHDAGDVGDRPLLIVGMHRSGTSLAASLLAGAGLDLGANMLGAGTGNLRGHYEDLDFLELHKRILLDNGLDEDGYSCPDHLAVPAGLAAEARRLLADRRAAGRPWGWKEPRTTLLLDFYAPLLPAARYLCVFRRPWEVVDSLFRRGHSGDRVFDTDPGRAVQVCHHYNELTLALAERTPERCLVVEATQLAAEPDSIVRRVGELMQAPLSPPPRVFDGELLHQDASAGRAAILAAVCPESIDIYMRLRSLAGSDSRLPSLTDGLTARALGETALHEWVRNTAGAREAKAAAAEVRETRAALDAAHAALNATHAACSAAHEALRDAIQQRETLARHTAAQATDLETLRHHAAAIQSHAAAQAADLEALQSHAAAQAADIESLTAGIAWHQEEQRRLHAEVTDLRRKRDAQLGRRLARLVKRFTTMRRSPGGPASAGRGDGHGRS